MVRADQMVAPLMGTLEAGLREEKLSFKQALLRALELAAGLMGFPEAAIYDAGALAAQMQEALLAEGVPAPQSAGEADALARQGQRRALSGLTRALCGCGHLPAEWTEPLCPCPRPWWRRWASPALWGCEPGTHTADTHCPRGRAVKGGGKHVAKKAGGTARAKGA